MNMINRIIERCLEKAITVSETIEQINNNVGNIERVFYRDGLNFTVFSHNKPYQIETKGLSRRQKRKIQHIAILCYHQARSNGSIFPGEIHISEYASTKHHASGFYEILNRYEV